VDNGDASVADIFIRGKPLNELTGFIGKRHRRLANLFLKPG
jgi:hypothetical protein